MIWLVAFTIALSACSGSDPVSSEANPTTVPPTTSQAPATAAPTSAPTTTSSTVASTGALAIGFEFRRQAAETDAYTYEISYPVLRHPDETIADAVNVQLEDWVAAAIEDLEAKAPSDGSRSTFTAQIAPELVSEGVFSLSGVTFALIAGDPTSVSGRVGWIFSLDSGDRIDAADLFIDRDLAELAATARAHLISDVLGDESAIVAPDGLLPEPANFDAVWLTAIGVGVGFDQFQVAAGDAGSPAVLITFAELEVALDKSGILTPLQDGVELPTG